MSTDTQEMMEGVDLHFFDDAKQALQERTRQRSGARFWFSEAEDAEGSARLTRVEFKRQFSNGLWKYVKRSRIVVDGFETLGRLHTEDRFAPAAHAQTAFIYTQQFIPLGGYQMMDHLTDVLVAQGWTRRNHHASLNPDLQSKDSINLRLLTPPDQFDPEAPLDYGIEVDFEISEDHDTRYNNFDGNFTKVADWHADEFDRLLDLRGEGLSPEEFEEKKVDFLQKISRVTGEWYSDDAERIFSKTCKTGKYLIDGEEIPLYGSSIVIADETPDGKDDFLRKDAEKFEKLNQQSGADSSAGRREPRTTPSAADFEDIGVRPDGPMEDEEVSA